MQVDYDYEDRLLERIAVREAAARLGDRQRRFLHRYYRLGETYDEIGQREGISRTRVAQVITQGFERLRADARRSPEPETVSPQQTTRDTPPVGFDKVAFLKHMRWLIKCRDEERARAEEDARRWAAGAKEREWQREMAAMDFFVSAATPAPLYQRPAPPVIHLPSQPSLQIRLPVQYTVSAPPRPASHPPPMAANDMAIEALNSFMGYRLPTESGSVDPGGQCSTVTFAVTGRPTPDELDEAMRRLAVEIPHDAILSAAHLSGAIQPTLAYASNAHVAVQAWVQWHNPNNGVASYRLAVTWDYAPNGTA